MVSIIEDDEIDEFERGFHKRFSRVGICNFYSWLHNWNANDYLDTHRNRFYDGIYAFHAWIYNRDVDNCLGAGDNKVN